MLVLVTVWLSGKLFRSKEHDGLGILNLRNFNLALKCKLLWQLFANNLHLKWPELIKSKYFSRNQYGAILNVAANKSSPLWQELKSCFPILSAFFHFQVNNGQNTIVWENRWFDDVALKYTLPDLYHISVNKKLTVAKMLLNFRANHVDLFSIIDISSPVAYVLALAQ